MAARNSKICHASSFAPSLATSGSVYFSWRLEALLLVEFSVTTLLNVGLEGCHNPVCNALCFGHLPSSKAHLMAKIWLWRPQS